MYLKALEIQGFKSFADKTVLSFGEDITAIVGPNGSGKSNIADAIRWVMGEQSTRTLRGSKMEDVIFDGTAKRKGLGFAEVSLVLDNTDHIFPREETEVAITRRYYRSGESEYYINRHSCRLRDINELLMDTGLGREGYSIIGQGRIDEILSIKSADRREVFEEAAGISRFRHRKEEAERKLERTQDNLVRINDKISELELQVEPLRVQAEKTRQYLRYREELRGLEVSVWMAQLEELRARSLVLQRDYDTAVSHREDARRALEELYTAGEEFSAQMRGKDIHAEELRGEQAQLEQGIHSCEGEINLLHNDMRNNSENMARIREEQAQQEGRAGSLHQQIEERRARLEEIEREMARCRAGMGQVSREVQRTLHSSGTLSEELEQLRERERLEQASAAEVRQLLSALTAAAQELLDRDQALAQELVEQEGKAAQTRKSAEGLRRELEQAAQERDSARNVISGYQMRLDARRKKLDTAQEKLRRFQMDEQNLGARIKMLSEMEKVYEGYSKAVKVLMTEAERGGLSGIRGPVAGLIQVPDQYAVAIEIALGGAMQHIVVERDQDGKQAIGWLKRRDAGRATFLPMNTVRPGEFREKGVERAAGFVGMANQLISFAQEYRDIFSSLLGRIVIAQDLDSAMAMARAYGHRFRIVTLDGQVLNAGGSMTGGSVSRSAGILSRANELERLGRQREGVQLQRKEAEGAVETVRRELTAAQYELDAASAQLRTAEDAVLSFSGRAEGAQSLLDEALARCTQIRREREQAAARSEENTRAIAQAKQRIAQLEGAAAALRAESEAKAEGHSTLQGQLEALNRQSAQYSAQLAGLDGERAASAQNLAELEQLRQDLSGDARQRAEMIARFEAQNQSLSAQVGQSEEQLRQLKEQSQQLTRRIQQLNEEKLELEGKRNQADRMAREKNTELLSMEREVSVLEQKASSARWEEEQILDKMWETYQLSHEAARSQRVELESVPKAQRRIGELKKSISALGSINPDAVEEFERINQRYTYLVDQRDDVTKAKGELEGIIAQIIGEMTRIFREQFDRINQTFQGTFQELFRGGKATLELEDPEDILNCGIEIRVQPPGKALKIISLLSGGEKAFVAIALYFAILKVRPTPFCVMDEIEAALDDANVVRFAQYMRRMSEKTQFIVITHRRGTMEESDVLYGVTMQEQGVSRMLTINLNDVERELNMEL